MLEIINIYAHGYVFIPMVHALKLTEFQNIIMAENTVNVNDVEKRLSINSGTFRVALRMLESIGWVSVVDNNLQLLQKKEFSSFFARVDDELMQPYRYNIINFPFDTSQVPLIKMWNETILRNKNHVESQIEQDLLDSPIITPLLISLKNNIGNLPITPTILSETLSGELLSVVHELFGHVFNELIPHQT